MLATLMRVLSWRCFVNMGLVVTRPDKSEGL